MDWIQQWQSNLINKMGWLRQSGQVALATPDWRLCRTVIFNYGRIYIRPARRQKSRHIRESNTGKRSFQKILMRKNNVLRKYIASLLLFLLFETVAITLWKAKGNLFYLLNFSYIGGCLALGTALFTAGKRYARHFLGVFEAATIHYAVAKIFGPLFFNSACSLR